MEGKKQLIYLEDRKSLKITEVTNVISITENIAYIVTNNETLCVKGSNLSLEKLSIEIGEVVIIGNINSLQFSEKKEKQSFFKRIFK